MKTSRTILSNNGILAVTAILLTVAAALAIVGVGIEAQSKIEGATTLAVDVQNQVTLYVMSGVMGEIPSVAGTLQSFALAIAYGLAPLVVLSMFAVRTFTGIHATRNSVTA